MKHEATCPAIAIDMDDMGPCTCRFGKLRKLVDQSPDEDIAKCDACGNYLKGGEPVVYADRSMHCKPKIYWHKDCFDRYVRPFDAREVRLLKPSR